MSLNKSRLYIILSVANLAGYIWLYYGISNANKGNHHMVGVCLIKQVTNIPCPSCGSTRSVLALLQGGFLESLYINPFGLLIALFMLVTPIWILFDLITKRKTLFDFYFYSEAFLKKQVVAIPLVLIVILNWIWNISKGL